MIKNVVWDWNGTIVDDSFLFVETMNSVLSDYSLPQISLRDYRKSFCFPIQKYWASLGFVFNKKQFDEMNHSFIGRYKKKMFVPLLHKNILCVLKKLQKETINQFVVSASENSLLLDSVEHYGLGGFFSSVWGVDNLNALGKESLAKELVSSANINPHETLLVGDTSLDYRVACSVGFSPLLVSFGHFSRSRLLKTGAPIVDSPKEILQHL